MEHNLADLYDAVSAAIPDRECIVWRDRRLTYAQVSERTNRLANHLIAAGLGVHTERDDLGGHESGQDHLACYLHNGNEYMEAMLGAYKARVAPFNVNYRYVTEELRYLLNDAGARAIVFHSAFASRLEEVLPDLPSLTVLLQVDDGSDTDLLPGAQWYEDALAAASRGAARRGAESRRPLHPLHRRHHRDAQGRALAPGGHLRRRPRGTEPRHGRRVGQRRRGRGGSPHRRRCACCPRLRSCTGRGTGWPSTP